MAEKYRGKIVDIHAHLGSFGKYKTVGLSNFWSKLTLSELLSYIWRGEVSGKRYFFQQKT